MVAFDGSNVKPKPFADLTREELAMIESIESIDKEFGRTIRVKVRSKISALIQIARALRMDKGDALTINSGDGPIQVNIGKEDAAVL